MDNTMNKMNFVQKKLSKLLKTNGNFYCLLRYGSNMYYLNIVCYYHSYDLPNNLYMMSFIWIYHLYS
jgi:hypothetical protein